jgi:phosphate transport system substrate-binding protein
MNQKAGQMGKGLKGLMTSTAFAAISLMGLVGVAAAEQAGLAKVDAGIASYAAPPNLSGNMVIAGSDTMQPLMLKLASAFQQIHKDTKIGVLGGGTERALMQFISDQSQIRRGDGYFNGPQTSGHVSMLAASRQLTDEEIKSFRARHGYEPIEIPIAMDAVALYVNRDNPIQGLTLEQVDAIFGTEHKRGLQEDIATWGQLGLEGWGQQPIHLYGRDKQSGTRTFFKHAALLEGDLKGTVREEPGSATEILAISRDALALGYAGIEFQTSMVRAVPLAEKAGMPFVAPGAESAASGAYPLSRPLYLYLKKGLQEEFSPVILEFLKFVNSREGQRAVVKAGAYPLSAAQVTKNLQGLTASGMTAASVNVSAN